LISAAELGLIPATAGRWLRPTVHRPEIWGRQVVTTATKVNIKPLEDRIVVTVLESEQTTASGIVIPDTAKEKPQEGTVLAVGPGRFENGQRLPLDIKEGDTVIFSKYGGTEVKFGADEYLILSARDVLAVVEK
jgi:chaperonin GroES